MADVPAIRSGSGATGDARPLGPARQVGPTGVSFSVHLKNAAHLASPLLPARTTATAMSRSPSGDGFGAPSDPTVRVQREADGENLGEERPRYRSSSGSPVDPLDPMTRTLLSQGALGEKALPAVALPHADAVEVASRVSLEHVMSRFVRRVAWSGDAHTGTARLEFGAGALEGGTLTIRSDNGAVSVSLELPPGADSREWRDRIARRLAARGLQIATIDVG